MISRYRLSLNLNVILQSIFLKFFFFRFESFPHTQSLCSYLAQPNVLTHLNLANTETSLEPVGFNCTFSVDVVIDFIHESKTC